MILAGDIGGTNARLALFTPDAKRIVREAVLPSRGHRTFGSVIDAFLGPKPPRLEAATFGIAGPVVAGRVKTTNLPWVLDERALAKRLGTPRVTFLNDLVALALGALASKRSELDLLQGSRPPGAIHGNVVVIAAGTGLGEAALVWDGSRFVPCAGEGGHADFAPRNAVESELLGFMARRLEGRVSYERVLSGPGLGAIYDFCRARGVYREHREATRMIAAAADRNATIAALGTSRKSPVCVAALSLFVSLYGAEAGNLALKYLAVGGVFFAGKIAASLAPAARRELLPSFRDKGRMRPLMEAMPVAIVKSSSVGIWGAARHAAGPRG